MIPTPGLTKRQHELYVFVKSFIDQHGYSPSFDEMRIGVGLKSKCGIHRIVNALKARGYVTYRQHFARSIEVTQGRIAA